MTDIDKKIVQLDRWKLAKSWSNQYFSTLPVEFTLDMGFIGKLSARNS